MNDKEPTGLCYYLKETLFDKWKKDRRDLLEPKWNRNRDDFKGMSTVVWKKGETSSWRSDTFIKMTKVKVLTAYSLVIDMLLQGGKLPFNLKPSPWDKVMMEDMPPDAQDVLKDTIDDAKGLVDQQLVDCHADRETMLCVLSAARYGETFIKKRVHEVTRKWYESYSLAPEGYPDEEGEFLRWQMQTKTLNAPAFSYVSCWNIFRDLETDDMQASVGYCERDFISPYELRQLIGKPYYIEEAIEDVIAEAPKPGIVNTSMDTESLPPGLRKIPNRFNTILRLEFWCRVPRTLYDDFVSGDSRVEHPEYDGDEVEVMAVVCGDRIVRIAPVESGKRPHDRVVWEEDLDDVEAIGVADNVEDVQMVLNGMVRAYEDNKKLSANVILATKRRFMPDFDGEIEPGLEIEISDDCDDARKALSQIVVADVGESLLSGISLMERFGDEVSMLPRIMQGTVAPKQKADTLGEMHMLQENAGKYIGTVIKNFDEGLIEPVVSWFFDYNMDDPEVTKGKGNFIAQALGFSSFQDKVVRVQKLLQAISLILSNPAMLQETKLGAALQDVFRGLDIDPDEIMKTNEEKQADMQKLQEAQESALEQARQQILDKTEAKISEIQAKYAEEMKLLKETHAHELEKVQEEFQNKLVEIKATKRYERRQDIRPQ